jgi:L-threonylcarbamoyladenylate synthase
MASRDEDVSVTMETRVLPVDSQHPAPEAIAQAAQLIRAGEVVAFPTETVYGLGADAWRAEAVQRIFEAKERPAHDPLIVHLADVTWLPQVAAHVPPVAHELAARFWPGPLTLVLPRGERIPDVVTAGGETVAMRVPAHPVALALLGAAEAPIAAPSANRFGHVSPTRAEHVLADLDGRIPLILDGGPTPVGVESTVLSLVTPTPTILRPGGVSREALLAVLGEVAVRERPISPDETIPSPGTLDQHYAPRANVRFYTGPRAVVLPALRAAAFELEEQGEHVGLLIAEEDRAALAGAPGVVQTLGAQGDVTTIARQLFAALRALDAAGVSVILARDFGSAGLGLAVRDRLTRAAGGDVIRVA